MANISLLFPPQQSISIKETISTDLPDFIPHHEVIFMGIRDLFSTKLTSLSGSDKSYLDSLKSSNDNDKAIASEIALNHNQIEYAKECVADIDNNSLCKRMQLMLNNVGSDRQQIKDDAAAPFQKDDEYKFVLLDYNLQTFSGATSDSNAIDKLLKTEAENMKNILSAGNCGWRFHLIYASLLCRITLDSKAVQQQIDLAQGKLGGDANSHYLYLGLIGDIYCKMREFEKARDALNKACNIMKNDGFCRTRLIYSYLYEKNFNKANEIWLSCCNDLKNSGCNDELLNCYTNYINLYANLDDEKNNESIMSWNGDDNNSFIGVALKLFILAYKSGKYVGDDKFAITETEEFTKTSEWTAKNDAKAKNASNYTRMVALFLKFFVDMYTNDEGDAWDMQGPLLDNVFSSFPRPLFNDILEALCLENYLLGMFKLRWKGDCKNAFRFSIICNCRGNMNSYIGEVVGFQNAGMSDIAVQKIQEIQQFVSVAALELFPIDAKRMSDDEKSVQDATNDLVGMIKKNDTNYDAMLALSDIYLSTGKWQSALVLMQQPMEIETPTCSKNLELKMKWATILFFNGYLPLAMQVFREYAMKDVTATAHEYYCGIAANVLWELGKQKDVDKMEMKGKFKGQNIWLYRFLCFKYWIEFFVKQKAGKKKKKQPKTGKSQYDKAIDYAKKIIRLAEDHPLGHALLARSNIELVDAVDGTAEKIEESVNKSVELADQLLAQKAILPRFYYESMIHCGVAMYQIDKDGSSYYQKACDNAPHGETPLMKIQRERITSKMDTQQIREILIDIQSNHFKMDGYKKAMPVFQYNLDQVVQLANSCNIFDAHSDLPETGDMAMNITKPDAKPSGKSGGKASTKKKKKPIPDTDDSKNNIPPPPPPTNNMIPPPPPDDVGGGGGGGMGPSIESPYRYANLCSNSWPCQRLTFSLPFDDAMQMAEALIMILRKEMGNVGLAPQDENDLIGRLHWGGEDALQDVLDKCEGKKDPLHLGLANFAYTYKVDGGIATDEHQACIDEIMNVTKKLSYEGKLGFAALRGLQGISFEADELYKEVATMKDADGLDWLYQRHYGQYLLVVKHQYIDAVKALEKAYKTNPKKDPMTIGWYIAALSKSGSMQDIQRIATIFDEIGKYHESHSNIAVIREEYLNNFEITTPLIYETLAKSGPTPFLEARKLISMAKYDRKAIESAGGITTICKGIVASKSNSKLFRILTAYFKSQACWFYNNSLKQCIDGMTNAGQLCMDWTLGSSFISYCFAKKNDWDSAMYSIEPIPTKTFDPVIFQCAAMLTDVVSEDVEMNKELSPQMFIGRVNNLRFGKKKKNIDLALKELTSEYLSTFKQDFDGLVALADIWLNRGAANTAYHVYYTIKELYPAQYNTNFILRLKFAECMRINGFQSEALNEFRCVYQSFDENDKGFNEEMKAISDLLIGYVLLNISIGDYESAEKILKKTNRKHILCKIAESELTLLTKSNDASATKGVYENCKEHKDNPLLLALAIRGGKLCGDADTKDLETKLKELINGKYAGITAVKEYCQLSAGIRSDSSKECLTNTILATLMNKSPDIGSNIYGALKTVYEKNKCPSARDIFGSISSFGVQSVDDEENVSIILNAQPPKIADITDDYGQLANTAENEIKAMKSGKVEKTKAKSGGKGGKKSGKKGVKKKKGGGGGGVNVKAGPKPKVNYNATPLSEKKKWAFQMADNLPTPRAAEVADWGPAEIGDFISKIPIFGLNEWYGNKFKENGVTGKMFLECNEQTLIKWGIDRKCHRARFRAEALAMKRRG